MRILTAIAGEPTAHGAPRACLIEVDGILNEWIGSEIAQFREISKYTAFHGRDEIPGKLQPQIVWLQAASADLRAAADWTVGDPLVQPTTSPITRMATGVTFWRDGCSFHYTDLAGNTFRTPFLHSDEIRGRYSALHPEDPNRPMCDDERYLRDLMASPEAKEAERLEQLTKQQSKPTLN
jgi:hypothetical protein